MKNLFNISEIANLVNISPATLRYWEDEKIFSVNKNKSNNYREYSINDLITIADIAFYRNLGVSVSSLRNFKSLQLEYTKETLSSLKNNLELEIKSKQAMLNNIVIKQNHIKEIENLKNIDYTYEKIPFKKVVSFEYTEKDKLASYIENTSRYVKYQNTSNLDTEIRGIIVDYDFKDENILWEYKKDQAYAVFLVEEIASENYSNNIKEKVSIINRKHKTGALLATFLLYSNIDNKQIDFLKAYVELLD